MRRRHWLLLILLLVVLAGTGLGWRWLRALHTGGLPVRTGQATVPGLGAPVQVRWDRWAVPHLRAASLEDLCRAQGWIHANDRMGQMEVLRRGAAGRLAELFGAALLPLDREFRRIGLRRLAAEGLATLSPESRRLLEAYAAGVNAWLAAHREDPPPLLRLTGLEPEPWEPADSLALGLLMGHTLSFFLGRPEELRFQWLRAFGPETARRLAGRPDAEIAEAILALAREATAASAPPSPPPPEGPGAAGDAGGSNNWALTGAWTASGHPLFANDPHLRLPLPPWWYQVHLDAPGLRVMGMSLPGTPGVLIGQNEVLAWGLTNNMLDDHDLFFEELDESGGNVRRGDTWVPVTERVEEIRVRGGEPVRLVVRSTDRGLLLDADPERGLPARSLAWTGLYPGDPIRAFLGLARARTLDEARAAAAWHACPAQNLVIAHRDEGILFTVLGRAPARRRGDGAFPAPAWDPSWGWDGLRPAAENPTVRNPAGGILVTANDDTVPPDYPGAWPAHFDTPFRASRIRELLENRRDWTAAELARVQTDVVSPFAREVVAALGGPYTGDAERARRALAAWDGTMERHGPPALFALFLKELGPAVFGDEEAEHRLPGPPAMFRRWRVWRLLRGELGEHWWDDVRTPPQEDRQEILARALERAWQAGVARWGADVAAWDYGGMHTLTLRHPLGQAPVIGGWFDRGPWPMPGSATTVAAFGGEWSGDDLPVGWGPSMRFVADTADPDRSLAVLPSGQSGHPGDPHYEDQVQDYLAGRLHPMHWSEAAITAATVATLELLPTASGGETIGDMGGR